MDGVPRMKQVQGMDRVSRLPEDVLWVILGSLDLRTIHTARLVCKRFRKSASEHFKAVDCTTLDELPTSDFTQFSATTYLAFTASHESHLHSLADPKIAPVITHVSLKGFHLRYGQAAQEIEAVLMRLPKLRSVSLHPLVADPSLPLFPSTLEELKMVYPDHSSDFQWAPVRDASSLTRYSQLTSLAIELDWRGGRSMASLSSLRNLRSLDLHSYSSALGPLSTFPALTSLTFKQKHSREGGSVFQELVRLTGLSRLALLSVCKPRLVTHVELACIAQLTNLTCLDMSGCRLANNLASSTALVALTRLVSVCFNTDPVLKAACQEAYHHPVRMPQLSLPMLEGLDSVGLGHVSDVSSLGRATGLTHLDLSCEITWGNLTSLQGLRPAVAGMSRLRSLEISVTTEYFHHFGEYDDHDGLMGSYSFDDSRWPVCCLDGVLRAATMLTRLVYQGKLRPDRDLGACVGLPGLRSLTFAWIRELTPAYLPALQAMSGLTELSLLHTGILAADITPDVMAAFDAERQLLGWPLLNLLVDTQFGRMEWLGMNRVRTKVASQAANPGDSDAKKSSAGTAQQATTRTSLPSWQTNGAAVEGSVGTASSEETQPMTALEVKLTGELSAAKCEQEIRLREAAQKFDIDMSQQQRKVADLEGALEGMKQENDRLAASLRAAQSKLQEGEPQIPYVKRVLVLKALLTADDVGIAEPDVFEEIEAEWGDFLRQYGDVVEVSIARPRIPGGAPPADIGNLYAVFTSGLAAARAREGLVGRPKRDGSARFSSSRVVLVDDCLQE